MGKKKVNKDGVLKSLEEEKQVLVGCNNRLAQYIDRVRALETEALTLKAENYLQKSTLTKEKEDLSKAYNKELRDVRKLLDTTSNDKAKVDIELSKTKQQLKDITTKLSKAENCLGDVRQKNGEMRRRLDVVEHERRDVGRQLNEALENVSERDVQLSTVRLELERAHLDHVATRNALQTCREDLDFLRQLRDREHTEWNAETFERRVSAVSAQLEADFDARLESQLDLVRREHTAALDAFKTTNKKFYEGKLNQLTRDLADCKAALKEARDRQLLAEGRVDELLAEAGRWESECEAWRGRHTEARQAAAEEARRVEREHERATERLERQLTQCRELLEQKAAFDVELGAYADMLDDEEGRINQGLTVTAKRKAKCSVKTGGAATEESTSEDSGVVPEKRRRRVLISSEVRSDDEADGSEGKEDIVSADEDGDETSSSDDGVTARKTKGRKTAASGRAGARKNRRRLAPLSSAPWRLGESMIRVVGADRGGMYVSVENCAAEVDVDASGWTIARRVHRDPNDLKRDVEETTFVFPPGTRLPSRMVTFVYSSSAKAANAVHDPPRRFVMDGDDWPSCSTRGRRRKSAAKTPSAACRGFVVTTLSNADGVEVARHRTALGDEFDPEAAPAADRPLLYRGGRKDGCCPELARRFGLLEGDDDNESEFKRENEHCIIM